MKAIILRNPVIPSIGFINMEDFIPENSENFLVKVEFGVGIKGQEGIDNFSVNVCTALYLDEMIKKMKKPVFLRRYLIIDEYNGIKIRQRIDEILNSISGNTWEELDLKLRQWFVSEFE